MVGKISIVVPVYNAQKRLEKCIESLINQTYTNIEIILVDDGSKDSSGEICDKYASQDERIVVIHQKNSGVSTARNTGINAATGEVVQFVDSDDWIELDNCEIAYKEYEKNKFNLIMWGFTNYLSETEKLECMYREKNSINNLTKGEFIYLKYVNQFNPPWNKLYTLDIIKRNNLKFNKELSLGEDLLFNLNYLDCMDERGEIIFINKCFYNYYEVDANSLSKTVKDDYETNREYLYDRLLEIVKKYTNCNEEIMTKYYTLRKRGMQKIIISVSNDKRLSFSEKYKKINNILHTNDYDTCIKKCEYGKFSSLKKMISNLKSPVISILLSR